MTHSYADGRRRGIVIGILLGAAVALALVGTVRAATSRPATGEHVPAQVGGGSPTLQLLAGTPEPLGMDPAVVPLHPVVLPSVAAIPVVVLPSPSRSVHSVVGRATWFATGPSGMFAAAGPALRVGHWRGRVIWVTANGITLRLVLNDWCQCSFRQADERAIDLSDEAFARLAPLSRGVLRVQISWNTP